MTSLRGALGLLVVIAAVVGLVTLVGPAVVAVGNPETLVRDALYSFDSPVNPEIDTGRTFVVYQGETASEIADRLQSDGLIENALVFRLMAEMDGSTSELTAGEYELSPSMTPSAILTILVEGRVKPAEIVTVPEGWRSEEIADRLAAKGIGTFQQFMELVRHYEPRGGLASSRPSGASLEGYLFPDSYSYTSKTTQQEIADQMLQRFDVQFSPEMRADGRVSRAVHP